MSEEREKLVAAMGRLDISTHGETFDDLLDFFELSVAAAEGTIRRLERERCRDRINALIALQGAATGTKRWHVARLSALMAARSAVMRGDDDGAPPL